MRHTYEPKFNVMLKLRGGEERWLMNADHLTGGDYSARGEHYENDANRLASALVKRGLAESYRLVKIAEPKGLPTYQRQP